VQRQARKRVLQKPLLTDGELKRMQDPNAAGAAEKW